MVQADVIGKARIVDKRHITRYRKPDFTGGNYQQTSSSIGEIDRKQRNRYVRSSGDPRDFESSIGPLDAIIELHIGIRWQPMCTSQENHYETVQL